MKYPIVRLEKVTKTFRTVRTKVHAIKDVSAEIYAGELLGLIGPSGSGKTTFLTIAGLIDVPTYGKVIFKNEFEATSSTPLQILRSLRRQNIGFIFQKPNLVPFLNAIENVQFSLTVNGCPKRISQARATELMVELGIAHRMLNYPNELSGGEQQRVSLARALANRPSLILADEPTASLDSERRDQVMTLLRGLVDRENVTICVVTHDTRSLSFFDRILTIDDGCIVDESHPEALRPVAVSA